MWLEGKGLIGLWIIKKTRWDKGNLEAGQGILLDFGGFLEKFMGI